eukprot:1789941-Rhodomonas_salina.1
MSGTDAACGATSHEEACSDPTCDDPSHQAAQEVRLHFWAKVLPFIAKMASAATQSVPTLRTATATGVLLAYAMPGTDVAYGYSMHVGVWQSRTCTVVPYWHSVWVSAYACGTRCGVLKSRMALPVTRTVTRAVRILPPSSA